MDEKHEQHAARAIAAGSPPLLNKSGNHHCDRNSSVQVTSCEIAQNLESIQEISGIAHGVYDVITGSINWTPTVKYVPGLNERVLPTSLQELLLCYSPPDAELARETLDWTIREKVRTETVVAVEKSPAPGNRHRLTFTPLPDEHAVVTKVLCLLQDLSETSNLDLGKKSVQGHAGLIAESLRDVLFRVSLPDGRYEHISQAVQNVTGYPPRSWYQNPFLLLEIILPAWRTKFERELRKFLRGNGQEDHTFPIFHQQGDIRWIHLRTTLLKDEQGNLLAIEGIASDSTEKMQQDMERKQLIRELKKALAEVKTLSGLLPICSFCKKVRDDRGYWNQIESYITEHSDLFFTHGLCPDCLTHHYPEYFPTRSAANSDQEF